MNKKLRSLICIALILVISIPVVSIVFAGKDSRGPPEKIVYIHYKKGYGKPEGTPGVGPDKDNGVEDEGYYKLLAKGVKWKKPSVNYTIDPDHSGLTLEFITGAISASAEEWDDWTGEELFNDTYTVDYDATWDDDAPDGRNELVFGNYPQEGVIAVCIVWGYFGGPPSGRYIIEFDIMFDTDYKWGDAKIDPDLMDLQNIATHELGHGVGLADLYNRKTTLETMYGYSHKGDIEKRDLYFGDIAGIQALYGPLVE